MTIEHASHETSARQSLITLPFTLNDGGRSHSKRPKQRNDCVVRALVLTTGMSYDDVYDVLRIVARRKSGQRFDLRGFLEATGNQFHNSHFDWKSYPAIKGYPRLDLGTFCRRNPTGTFIVKVSKHVLAVIDGVAIDDAPISHKRCVYGSWQVTRLERIS